MKRLFDWDLSDWTMFALAGVILFMAIYLLEWT